MPAVALETLTAVYLEESFRWDSTAIFRCETSNGEMDPEVITIKCYDCEENEFERGMSYCFYGKWQEYQPKPTKWNRKPDVELQFHARKWRKVKEAAFVDLGSLLDGRGFPHSLPKKLVRDYGGDAADGVRRNPWLLLQYKSTGVSRTDKLYLDLGGNPAAIKRQAIILWKCLLDAGHVTGDTWQREAAAEEMLRGQIAGAELQFQKAVELASRGKLIYRRWDENLNLWLAEGKRARHERYIAERVAEMMVESEVGESCVASDGGR